MKAVMDLGSGIKAPVLADEDFQEVICLGTFFVPLNGYNFNPKSNCYEQIRIDRNP